MNIDCFPIFVTLWPLKDLKVVQRSLLMGGEMGRGKGLEPPTLEAVGGQGGGGL